MQSEPNHIHPTLPARWEAGTGFIFRAFGVEYEDDLSIDHDEPVGPEDPYVWFPESPNLGTPQTGFCPNHKPKDSGERPDQAKADASTISKQGANQGGRRGCLRIVPAFQIDPRKLEIRVIVTTENAIEIIRLEEDLKTRDWIWGLLEERGFLKGKDVLLAQSRKNPNHTILFQEKAPENH